MATALVGAAACSLGALGAGAACAAASWLRSGRRRAGQEVPADVAGEVRVMVGLRAPERFAAVRGDILLAGPGPDSLKPTCFLGGARVCLRACTSGTLGVHIESDSAPKVMIRFDSEAQARQWQQVLARAAALSAPSAQRIQQLLDDLDTLSASNCSLERSCTSLAVQRAAAGSPPAAPGAPPAVAAPAAAAPRPRSPARLEKLRQSGEALRCFAQSLESAPAFPEPAGAPPAGSAGG